MPRLLSEDELVDGWIVVYRDLFYWVVKGYAHPPGSLVAIPYRTSEGRRLSVEEYSSVSPLWLFEWVDCIGRFAPLLDLREIIRVYDPFLGYRKRIKDLPSGISELVDHTAPDAVGLTGSWLLGLERRESDVDLLIYGRRGIYEVLRDLAAEGLIRECGSRLALPRLYGFTLTDACFKNTRYTIRLLRRLDSEDCRERFLPLGFYRGPFRIVDSSDSYMVPARYLVYLDLLGVNALMETWHTRFMELAPGSYSGKLFLKKDTLGKTIIASPDLEGHINVYKG